MRELTKEQIQQVAGAGAASSYDPSHGHHKHKKHHHKQHNPVYDPHPSTYGHTTYDPYSAPPAPVY